MILKRIEPLSAFKVGGVIYAALGLVVGAVLATLSFFQAAFMAGSHSTGGLLGLFVGAGAIVFLPVFYGLLGALMGAVMSWVYNFLVGITGGLRFDLE